MLQKTSHFMRQANLINGEWVQADSGQTVDVNNPATGLKIGTVPKSGKAETRRAIEAADAAFKTWRKTTALERSKLLRKLHDAMMDNQDVLAELLTIEQGKSLFESKGEIGSAAAYILWFAEEGRRTYGDVVPSPWADRRILVTKEPVGVIAAITPWNFPSSMLARKLGPALAAGCTAVVKPASQTPYSGLAWGALAEEVGFPKGVVNILTGSASEIGDEICANPLVSKITFTGSTEVGKLLIQKSSVTVKKVSMELGGNAPFIVFDDADIDRAVAGAITAKYRNSGQTCVCTNRFYVQDGVYDAFVGKLTERVKALRVGYGMEPVDVGPLIDEAAVAKVEEHLENALSGGARLLAGGHRSALGGTFFEPTVVSDVKPDMLLAQEETFGPLAGVIRFGTEDEAIRLANASEFGLASYFYARDLSRVWRVAEALEAGMVGINTGLISTEVAPFGGIKQSGLGREGSRHGLDDYLEIKYLCMGI